VTARTALSIGLVAFASLGAAGLYAHRYAAPACDSEQALGRVYEIPRDEFHFDSVLVNNITTVSGGFFSDRHECSAEVTEIRGNVNASDMPWREVRYWIVPGDKSERSAITVRLGGGVPLAEPTPSLWKRLPWHI
jgi:hypothetical protein